MLTPVYTSTWRMSARADDPSDREHSRDRDGGESEDSQTRKRRDEENEARTPDEPHIDEAEPRTPDGPPRPRSPIYPEVPPLPGTRQV